MSEPYYSEEWNGPGDDYYPGSDDDDETNAGEFELLAYPLDNDPDDGITTDDFDNWPKERGFPS